MTGILYEKLIAASPLPNFEPRDYKKMTGFSSGRRVARKIN